MKLWHIITILSSLQGIINYVCSRIPPVDPNSNSNAVPVEESLPYNPQEFYPSSYVLDGSVSPEDPASRIAGGSESLPYSTARGQVGSNSLSGGFSVVRFSRHENHPEWDRWLIKNDVGVLVLDEKLKSSERARHIAIDYDWVGGGEPVRVTGWGRLAAWGVLPDWLQELVVVVLSPGECEALVREANALLGPSPPVDPRVELCTRHLRGAGHGMCNGDSGSAVT